MKIRALIAAIAVALITPMTADAQTNEVAVTVFEGVGNVCTGVQLGSCEYDLTDPLWTKATNNPHQQGLYWPGVGPRATYSPTFLAAGPGLDAPNSACVSSAGGPGCIVIIDTPDRSFGVFPSAAGVGAYCGSSRGRVRINFSAADGSLNQVFIAEWQQSAATILPTVGSSTDGNYTLVGFSSSRGLSGSGNCGATQATTGFQVEGWSVSFPSA